MMKLRGTIGWIGSLFSKNLEYNEEEKLIKIVVEKLVNNPDSKFRFAPISSDLLIKDVKNSYYLVINSSRIKISNHTFSIDKSCRLSFIEEMREIIWAKMETERQKAIEEIFENEKILLNNIIEKLG